MTEPANEDGYPIPAAEIRVEDDIRNSRFITTLAPAETAEAARSLIERVRSEFPDATHNCWAFAVGPPGSTLNTGASDDGEPGGTAGRPMLIVLLNSGSGDVVAVVTRYFGGVKLGRGGLVRAYGGGVQRALREVAMGRRIERIQVSVTVPYAAVDPLRRALPSWDAVIASENFGEEASLVIVLPRSREQRFRQDLLDLTAGRARFEE
jgi:uncharacterized YigZ family protein